MKITIAYTADSEPTAAATIAQLQKMYPQAKIRRCEHHEPYKHIYLTTPEPKGQTSIINKP